MQAVLRNRWKVIALALTFPASLLLWAFSSPVGSAPDDDQHIANIYCISDPSTCRSDDWAWPWDPPSWAGDPADRQGPEYAGAERAYPDLWRYANPRELPCYVTNGTTWYAPDSSVSATCLNDQDPTNNRPATIDLLGYYPNVYYRVMSVFTQDTIRASIVTWRALNVVIATIMLAGAIILTAPGHRRAVAVGTLIASMPLGLFLITSMNPTSWLLIGTAALLGPGITLLRDQPRLAWVVTRIAFVILCLLLMVSGRSEGIGHVAVLGAVVLLLGLKAPRYVYGLVGSAVAVAGFVALLALRTSDAAKAQATLDFLRNGLGIGSLWDAVLSIPSYFFGIDVRLGWLEITPPAASMVASSAAFCGAALLGLAALFGRKLLALITVTAVLIFVPAAMVAGGWTSPPTRYFLPLVYMLAFVFLVPDWGKWLPRWSNAQWIFLGAALSIANSLSLLWLTVRYVSGIQPGTTNPMNLAAAGTPEWWWGAWLSPFWNWALGSVVFAVAVGLLFTLPSVREGVEDHLDEAEPEPPDDPYREFWEPPEDRPAQIHVAR